MIDKIRVYLDTNILIDLIIDKDRPNRESSLLIIQGIMDGRFEGYFSTQSIIDAAYVAQKKEKAFEPFKKLMKMLLKHINTCSISYGDIQNALDYYSGDFEDDAQFEEAENLLCRFFITGDKRMDISGHPSTEMEVISPQAFINLIKQ